MVYNRACQPFGRVLFQKGKERLTTHLFSQVLQELRIL